MSGMIYMLEKFGSYHSCLKGLWAKYKKLALSLKYEHTTSKYCSEVIIFLSGYLHRSCIVPGITIAYECLTNMNEFVLTPVSLCEVGQVYYHAFPAGETEEQRF